MRTIRDIGNLKDKKVLFRADFDVPLGSDNAILEPFRTIKQKEAIDALVSGGARVVMVAHIKAADSFKPLVAQFEALLGHQIVFIEDIAGIAPALAGEGSLFLLDNVRRWPGEKADDPEFARALAQGFDAYVNNAFAVCHRDHASVSAVAGLLPAYAGPLVERETGELAKALTAPAAGKVIVMGGAKAETKVPVIKNFLDKAERILLGGVIVNDILKAQGKDIGQSVADEDPQRLLAGLDPADKRLVMPQDYVIDQGRILDIGPQAIASYQEHLKRATMAIWNGPMGMFEDERFAAGTAAIARSVAESDTLSVIGGGDTIAAVDRLGMLDKFDFVSTGGGAMLAFLAGQELPGLKALGYYG